MSAAVAQRQSSSPIQIKRNPPITSNKPDIKAEGNHHPPHTFTTLNLHIDVSFSAFAGQHGASPQVGTEMDTPNFLVSDKFLLSEHNPFEQSFAIRPGSSGNGTDTPKPSLPGVTEMFTPVGTNH